MSEVADIYEDFDISPDDVAVTIILKGIFPRVIEEVLLYVHGIETPGCHSP